MSTQTAVFDGKLSYEWEWENILILREEFHIQVSNIQLSLPKRLCAPGEKEISIFHLQE